MKRFVVVPFLSLLILQFSYSASIKGRVLTPDGKPVMGALVVIVEESLQTFSNETGTFYFNHLPAGQFTLIVSKQDVGYNVVKITLKAHEKRELRIKLEKKGQPPDFSAKRHSKSSTPKTIGSKGRFETKERLKKIEPEGAIEFHAIPEKPSGSPVKTKPESSGLRAGFADDNKQFNYFISFLEKFASEAKHFELPIKERLWIKVVDLEDRPINNALVQVFENTTLLETGKTYADGSFFIYPLVDGLKGNQITVKIGYGHQSKTYVIDRHGARILRLQFPLKRTNYQQIPLDLLFILDTTGSMGEEIERLKNTIQIINDNLLLLRPKPDIRFGLILYRDRGDTYQTLFVPFSRSLEYFQHILNQVEAGGGGDYPEDLQSALQAALQQMNWRADAIRLSYIITDAPPHLDYQQNYTYVQACKDARRQGIKFFTVGTGGLDINGEYVLRQIAQFTYGKYIFLTYGEQGESEGGKPGSVSHHTGANFTTDKLETVIIRFTKQELLYQSDQPIVEPQPYFEATKIDQETREQTLNKLFNQALNELWDFAAMVLSSDSKVAILPIASQNKELGATAEYFTEQLNLVAQKNKRFTLLERSDLQKIAEELRLQLSGLVPDSTAAKVGKLIGADLVIIGRLFKTRNQLELFLKLERVSTAEILSITKAKIDRRLGL